MRRTYRAFALALVVGFGWLVPSEAPACHVGHRLGRALFGSRAPSCPASFTFAPACAPSIAGDVAPPPVLWIDYPAPSAAPFPAPAPQAPTKAPPVASPPAPTKVVPAPQTSAADPFGFVAWLNGQRAARRLGGVVYSAELAAVCTSNNAVQRGRGLGHWVRGGRRQNAAMGSYSQATAAWVASPAHASALFDPTITLVGIASDGVWWTFDAN